MAKRRDEIEPETTEPMVPQAPMGIDLSTEAGPPAAASVAGSPSADAPARQGVAPFCPAHPKIRMKSNRSEESFTRYYCPIASCKESLKIGRPTRPHTDGEDCPYHAGVPTIVFVRNQFFARRVCPVEGCTFAVNTARSKMAERVARAAAEEQDFNARP